MKKKSAVGNRVLAAFLAAAMVGTYLPAIPAAAAGGDGDPAVLAQFTFDDAGRDLQAEAQWRKSTELTSCVTAWTRRTEKLCI